MATFNPFLGSTFQIPDLQEQQRFLQWFLKTDMHDYLKKINAHSSEYWLLKGQEKALSLFHMAAKLIPAYHDFLEKNKVNLASIQTFTDFVHQVPITDKKNYISQYSQKDLSWNGNLQTNSMVSFSSGTSGSPFFWPRNAWHDIEGAFFHEHLLANLFEAKQKTTLVVICFALGNYVAGTYTLTSLQLLALKGYPLTIVTPGINYEDTYKMIKKLAPFFEQVVLCGYPPFIKDIIELGKTYDFAWEKHVIKFLFASEFFSEQWRRYIFESIGKEMNLRDSTNIYGAADATLFGFETPLTTLLRQWANADQNFHQEIFDSPTTPTVVQYNPLTRYFEVERGELLLTAGSGLPLLRYNLHDHGKVITIEEAHEHAATYHFDLKKTLENATCGDTFVHLPIVTVQGRTDGAVSLYGLLIYPEYISFALEKTNIHKAVSGKFSLEIKNDKKMEQQLWVHVELRHDLKSTPALKKKIIKALTQALKQKSSEYAKLLRSIEEKATPNVVLYEKKVSDRFAVGVKQKWTIN